MKQRTTWVAIIAGIAGIILTITVFLGRLTGTEYAAAMGGVGTFATVLIGVFAKDNEKECKNHNSQENP